MSIFDDPDDQDDDLSGLADEAFRFDGDGDGGAGIAPDVVTVLDSPEAISVRDPARLLWALATAGAQVRRAISARESWPADRLTSDFTPRSALVVTDTAAGVGAALLAELGGDRTAVVEWRGLSLPRWAGPADVLLAASIDGRHPRVAMLVAEAARRGLTVVVATPPDTPVAAAAGREIVVPIEAPISRRAALWTLLTPLLLAGSALGFTGVTPGDLQAVADALDRVAELARPDTDAFTNVAKQLAIEAIDTELMLAGIGPFSSCAAVCMARSMSLLAGITAVPLSLPDDVTRAGALLDISIGSTAAADSSEDFFRDRVDEPGRHRRLIFLDDTGPEGPREEGRPRSGAPEELSHSGQLAAIALGHLASTRSVLTSTLDLPGNSPLARFAAATAFGDFIAAYAAIGRGIDPTAARAGELPH